MRPGSAHGRSVAGAALSAVLGLGACNSGPPVPDWQLEAHASLQRATQAYLAGDSRVAAAEYERARRELSSTGRADLVARGELLRCAARLASLESIGDVAAGRPACPAFEPLRADAGAAQAAYADFLGAAPGPQHIELLPQNQRAAAAAGSDAAQREAAVRAIEDPLSRLVAAAASLRDGVAPPGLIAGAVETASAQGWRRPLLAWLTVQLRRAEAAGDDAALQQLRRRIELVGSAFAGSSR